MAFPWRAAPHGMPLTTLLPQGSRETTPLPPKNTRRKGYSFMGHAVSPVPQIWAESGQKGTIF